MRAKKKELDLTMTIIEQIKVTFHVNFFLKTSEAEPINWNSSTDLEKRRGVLYTLVRWKKRKAKAISDQSDQV